MNTKIKQPDQKGFSRKQMEEIKKGIDAGLDVSVYAKKEFLAIQMQQIRLGLLEGLPVSQYAKTDYDWFQMEEIRKGLQEGIDIAPFASPDISYDRMQQIRLGIRDHIDLSPYKRLDSGVLKQIRLALEKKINIVSYIIEGYDAEQLEAIRNALELNIEIEPWVSKEYRGIALREIFLGLEDGWDVSVYAKMEYNWQQMREIRLGIEHMVDIEQYNAPFYSYRQMQEIRLGLEAGLDVSFFRSPMYTAAEMHKRRIALEENPSLLIQNKLTIADVDDLDAGGDYLEQHYRITISDDEMEAYMTVCGSLEEFDRLDIVKALYKKGICYGVKYDVIDDVVNGNTPRRPLLIAQGKKHIDGRDGWYEFFFRTECSAIPKELENEKIDYRKIEWFETVEKGQKLAVYHNAQKGEDGITITGKVISAKRGIEKNHLVGKGFTRLKDRKTYISDIQGVVKLSNYQLNVSPVLIMKEVNLATGNVDYDGNVLIEGNVSSGSTIKASKDIIVKGYVEAASIICGGSVLLQKGMNGSGDGSIRAEKDVVGYFFEGVKILAGGDIQGDYFFKSDLQAKGEIRAVGRKGMIAGGTLRTESGAIVRSLGNQVGLLTCVIVGRLERLKQIHTKLIDTIQGVRQELLTLESAHKQFQKKYAPEIRNSMEIYLKIESAIYTKEKEMENHIQEKESLEKEMRTSSATCIVVAREIFEGVTVEIDGSHWKSKNIQNIVLRKVDNRIGMYSME